MTEPRRLLQHAETSPLLRDALQLGLDQPDLPDAVRQRVGARLAVALGAGAAGLAGSEIAAAASNALAGSSAAQGVGAVGAGVSTGTGAAGAGVATTAAATSGMAAAGAAGTAGITAASTTAGAGALLGGSTLAGMVVNGVLGVAISVGAVAGVSQIITEDAEGTAPNANASVESAARVESTVSVVTSVVAPGRATVSSADGVETSARETSVRETTAWAQRPPDAQPRAVQQAARVASDPAKVTPPREPASEQRRAELVEEVRALRRIGALVDGQPAAALRGLDEHAARFGSSQLGAEAALLRIRALLGNGQRAQAVRLAEDLLSAPAARIYHERVRALLGRVEAGKQGVAGSNDDKGH